LSAGRNGHRYAVLANLLNATSARQGTCRGHDARRRQDATSRWADPAADAAPTPPDPDAPGCVGMIVHYGNFWKYFGNIV
jgi:hypothetical protein